MTTINLDDYQIHFGAFGARLREYLYEGKYNQVFIIVDEHTRVDCLPFLEKEIGKTSTKVIEIESGEINKNITTCTKVWAEMMEQEAGRKDLTINLGGGVIGDMGGFCASTFKRGMDFIQMPTTLLSQVDASVGGKLGIDFAEIKNSIGLFKNPLAVIIWPQFLETLPARELRSGFAEVIKHSLIASKEQWMALQHIKKLNVTHAISFLEKSVLIKKNIVEADPFESGLRKVLNFGHTIGHALESCALKTDKPLLHGEAIAAGRICESYLSLEKGLSRTDLDQITQFLLKHYGKFDFEIDIYPRLMALMQQDKKNETDEINFTMLKSPGKALFNQFASEKKIIASLDYYRNQEKFEHLQS